MPRAFIPGRIKAPPERPGGRSEDWPPKWRDDVHRDAPDDPQTANFAKWLGIFAFGHPLAKPDDLLIAASDEVTAPILQMMMSHAANKSATFLALFQIEDDTALLDKIMIVDGSTKKGEINICGGKFVQKPDGTFVILSVARDEPYEYCFSRRGRRLIRRAVSLTPGPLSPRLGFFSP